MLSSALCLYQQSKLLNLQEILYFIRNINAKLSSILMLAFKRLFSATKLNAMQVRPHQKLKTMLILKMLRPFAQHKIKSSVSSLY